MRIAANALIHMAPAGHDLTPLCGSNGRGVLAVGTREAFEAKTNGCPECKAELRRLADPDYPTEIAPDPKALADVITHNDENAGVDLHNGVELASVHREPAFSGQKH